MPPGNSTILPENKMLACNSTILLGKKGFACATEQHNVTRDLRLIVAKESFSAVHICSG